MTRESRLHCNVGSLRVTDLTDHDDVRRLTENRAERRREVEADVTVHLHLVDAAHLVFDRVLDRDDLAVGQVDLSETGVERSRLSGTGRARHEDHAVGKVNQALELVLVVGKEAELRKAEREVRLVENTHDD